ncbi:MAG: hypothetical protein MJ137_04685 [Clostridia bacterium]|nr:hypothetical protein [Clostridia bacterium]
MEEKQKLSISAKSFAVSMVIIIALMVAAYVLTFVLPSGEFVRVPDGEGNQVIDTSSEAGGVFEEKDADFPFHKFLLSPILVLGSDGNVTLIMILVFLLIIGGVFQALSDKGLIEYLLRVTVDKFYSRRRLLLIVLPLVFMLLASFAGVFEEVIPLVPILCALAVSLGWDNMTGLGFSVIPCAAGYAAGLFNPFGTGIAQKVAGVTVFGGLWMRAVVFVVLYAILVAFLMLYTAGIEKQGAMVSENAGAFEKDVKKGRGIAAFGVCIAVGVLLIVSSIFIEALRDYTLVIFALCFLIGGITGCALSGMSVKDYLSSFFGGVASMLPAIVMILFASSIKYILTESMTIDSLIRYLLRATEGMSPFVLILFIYLVVLIMEFFVPSGSAKAFLLMPLLVPVASVYSIPVNMIVLAYIFGDGLANVMYPTNAALLIALNLAGTSYPKYMKFSWKIMLSLFAATCGLLLFAMAVGYR